MHILLISSIQIVRFVWGGQQDAIAAFKAVSNV